MGYRPLSTIGGRGAVVTAWLWLAVTIALVALAAVTIIGYKPWPSGPIPVPPARACCGDGCGP